MSKTSFIAKLPTCKSFSGKNGTDTKAHGISETQKQDDGPRHYHSRHPSSCWNRRLHHNEAFISSTPNGTPGHNQRRRKLRSHRHRFPFQPDFTKRRLKESSYRLTQPGNNEHNLTTFGTC